MNEPLIRCEGLHKSYMLGRTTLPVLRGVSIDFEAGAFVAITGSSGSGKSTLLHVLSGLDVPQRGQVFFEDEPIFEPEGERKIPVGRDASVEDIAAAGVVGLGVVRPGVGGKGAVSGAVSGGIRLLEHRRNRLLNTSFGFVFQFFHLLPEFNILENVLLPRMVGQSIGGWLGHRGEDQAHAHALLSRVGLSDRMRHRPSELSGGERQRVAIARALVNKPAVLFADEPTGNLDGKTGRDVFNLLKRLNRESGQTIIIVTHDRDLSREADRVVHLVDGRVQ